MKLAEQNLFKSKGLGGRTGTVASVVYYRPWGPWFETWPGSRSLRPCASHIYPLFSTGYYKPVRLTWTDSDAARDYSVP